MEYPFFATVPAPRQGKGTLPQRLHTSGSPFPYQFVFPALLPPSLTEAPMGETQPQWQPVEGWRAAACRRAACVRNSLSLHVLRKTNVMSNASATQTGVADPDKCQGSSESSLPLRLQVSAPVYDDNCDICRGAEHWDVSTSNRPDCPGCFLARCFTVCTSLTSYVNTCRAISSSSAKTVVLRFTSSAMG